MGELLSDLDQTSQELSSLDDTLPLEAMAKVIDDRNLATGKKNKFPRSRAHHELNGSPTYRKRSVLARAYPAYKTNSFSEDYLDHVYVAIPQLLRNDKKRTSRSEEDIEAHIRRLQMWTSGESIYEMAQEESVALGTIKIWRVKFPIFLRDAVNFYELVHATDELMDSVEVARMVP